MTMEENTEINIVERVNKRLDEGIKISFEDFFGRSYELFKKTWWQIMIGYIMITAATTIISNVLNPLFMGSVDYDPKNFMNGSSIDWEELFNFIIKMQSSPMVHVLGLVTGILTVFLSAPLQAGFLKMCREGDKGEVNIGSLFSYFRSPYTGKLIIAGLITVFLNSLCAFLLSFIPIFGSFINIFFTLVFYFLFIFVIPLIIFGNASIQDAFSLSVKLCMNKFFPIVGFMFLSYLLSICGLVACCIGVIVTIGFLWIGVYHLYKDAVGFPEDEKQPEEPPHWQQQPPSI